MTGIHPGEPEFGPWVKGSHAEVAEQVVAAAGQSSAPVGVIAIDGRSGGGKTALAGWLAAVIDLSVIVHTDDLSWNSSFFDWADLMIDEVLVPARRGDAVRFRPEAWRNHDRDGAIEVPAGVRWVIVEGVGAGRREMSPLIDVVVWVQSEDSVARYRGIERDGGDAGAAAFWDEWMAAELPFLAEQRPWERAAVIVNGTPPVSAGPPTLLMAVGPARPDPPEAPPL